jgi:ribosomal protein S25
VFENGIKVIQSSKEKRENLKELIKIIATFNQESDFQKNIKQHVDPKYGITLEQLAKKAKISLTIARVKLEVSICLSS